MEGLPSVWTAWLHQRGPWSMPICWQNWPLCDFYWWIFPNVPQTQTPTLDCREWHQRFMGICSVCRTIWHTSWRTLDIGIPGVVMPNSLVRPGCSTLHRNFSHWIRCIRNRGPFLGRTMAPQPQWSGANCFRERLTSRWRPGSRPMWLYHQGHALLQLESSLPSTSRWTPRTRPPSRACSQSHRWSV